MNILFIEPFFSGSHRAWLEQLQQRSRHQIQLLTLPGRFWKWRMEGGAISLAKVFLAGKNQPDLIVASDMLDVTTFQALTRQRTASIPFALYFHENQLTYPWSPKEKKGTRRQYALVNYRSAMAVDRIFFNSCYHQNAFLEALPKFLKAFPDHQEVDNVEEIRKKSVVLTLALDLKRFDAYRCPKHPKPLILWNHRWEYDKNPTLFFDALRQLQKKGKDFDVAVLGKNIHHTPNVYQQAAEHLGERLLIMGFAKSFSEYAQWLWRATHIPVTSNQDFFGISAIEGIYCRAIPLLPRRLAFPEHLPEHANVYYPEDSSFEDHLELSLKKPVVDDYAREVARYDWSHCIAYYDEQLESVLSKG